MFTRRSLLALFCTITLAVGVVVLSGGSGEASSKGFTAGPVSMPANGDFVVRLFNPTTKPIEVNFQLRDAVGGIGNSGQTVTVASNSTETASVGCGISVSCTGVPFVPSTKLVVSGVYDSADTGGKVAVPFGGFRISA